VSEQATSVEPLPAVCGESASIPALPPIPPELFDPEGVIGKPFTLPGFNGHAFRGDKIPDLKRTDPVQPSLGMEAHAFVFDLGNAKHLEYYSKIFHMAYNGKAAVGIDRVDFDAKTGTYKAFVRWAFLFSHMKNGGSRG